MPALRFTSPVFLDMLGPDNSPPFSADKPIDLDYLTEVIESFLSLGVKTEPGPQQSLDHYLSVIELGSKFESKLVKRLLSNVIAATVAQSPWNGFVLASLLDEIHLARHAICHMGDRQSWLIEGKIPFSQDSHTPSPPYLFGIINGVISNESRDCARRRYPPLPLLQGFPLEDSGERVLPCTANSLRSLLSAVCTQMSSLTKQYRPERSSGPAHHDFLKDLSKMTTPSRRNINQSLSFYVRFPRSEMHFAPLFVFRNIDECLLLDHPQSP